MYKEKTRTKHVKEDVRKIILNAVLQCGLQSTMELPQISSSWHFSLKKCVYTAWHKHMRVSLRELKPLSNHHVDDSLHKDFQDLKVTWEFVPRYVFFSPILYKGLTSLDNDDDNDDDY